MAFSDTGKIADKIINIFSDNKVTDSEWYHDVPLLVIQTALPVVVNINNFADGMKEHMAVYNVEIPQHRMRPSNLIGERPQAHDWGLDLTDERDVAMLLDDSRYLAGDVNPYSLG